MANTHPSNEPSAIRLMRLMNDHLPEILLREQRNEGLILLYGTGEYWTAFEKSACQLCRIFPEAETSVLANTPGPFPAVMASITDERLTDYGRRHSLALDLPDYKEISVPAMQPEQYSTWYRETVKAFMPAIKAMKARKSWMQTVPEESFSTDGR